MSLYLMSAVPASASTILLTFNGELNNDEYLRDQDSYSVSGGLVVRRVEVVAPKQVLVHVSPEMAVDQEYTISLDGVEVVSFGTYRSTMFGSGTFQA